MSDFSRAKLNPIELINNYWPEASVDHIDYDPCMKDSDRDYWIIRSCGGDGTLMFTLQMIQEALIPLVNMTSYYKHSPPKDWSKVKRIRYTVGSVKHATVFGRIKLRCSDDRKYPGQRESVRIPVKCEYIYK